jgi:hypothetical protein
MQAGAVVMGQHILCVIESELDSSFDRLQLEMAMHDRDWIPVAGMDAFYRHFESGISDDLAIERAEADLKHSAEGLGVSPPEAVLAIA